jgi:hypothetical protein
MSGEISTPSTQDQTKLDYEKKRKADKAACARQWRAKHADIVKSRFECECGSTYLYCGKTNHMRTDKHRRFVEFQNQLKTMQSQLESKSANATH